MSAFCEGFPVTGVVFCQTRGRRLIAHGSEKSTVCATENIESEKLLRCAHLSLDIGFCGPLQMTQYTRELIEGKGAWQLGSGAKVCNQMRMVGCRGLKAIEECPMKMQATAIPCLAD
jgi:hypothetical protein